MADLEKLRKQIAAGEYQLDAASIAGALLDYANVGEPSRPSDARPADRQPQGLKGLSAGSAGGST